MVEALEIEKDTDALSRAVARQAKDYIPLELAERIWNGENPVRVWRKHRNLTQAALAMHCGLARPYIAQIEGGVREMSVETLCKLAEALDRDMEFLCGNR